MARRLTGKQDAFHQRLRRRRGPAKSSACAFDCGQQAYDWAYIHGTDPEDYDNYQPLCRRCHTLYDRSPHKEYCSQGHDIAIWGRKGLGTCAVCLRISSTRSRNKTRGTYWVVCWHCGYGYCKCDLRPWDQSF